MKSRITLIPMAVVIAFALAACGTDIIPEKPRPDIRLLSVKIGNMDVSGIPEPVFDEVWEDEDYQVASADFGIFVVKPTTETEDVTITATATAGARIRWGIASGGNRPDYFHDHREPVTFTTENFLYFKVTAGDGVTSNYYRFYPVDASPVKELVTVVIAGHSPNEITVGTGASAPKFTIPYPATSMKVLVGYTDDDGNEVRGMIADPRYLGRIDITRVEMLSARIEAEPQDKNARIRFAVAEDNVAALNGQYSEFRDTVKEIVIDENEREATRAIATEGFRDGNILFIEVAAETDDINCYGFYITAGRIATISSLKLDNVEVTGKGTPHDTWASISPGSFSSADQGTGGFTIAVDLEDPQAICDYAIIGDVSASAPSAYGTPSKVEFIHKQVLALRVQSARRTPADTRYYKVEVNLLAANFTQQPKSDYYYYYDADTLIDGTLNWYTYVNLDVDPDDANFTSKGKSTVKPLSFKLDRGVESDFDYQWYEANSWYGGYGFDADGKILYYKTGETDPTMETGFTSDDYHQDHFDEKRNVSLHNGGNQFYNLPIPGRAIPGATQATYTPEIDYRPFIAGFTNESHYYWVEVTNKDNGRKVTSQRATIVSERNPAKEHYIVDLYAYLDKDENGNIVSVGLQDSPRNPTPFKAGNHGDKYAIPITFPEGFNIMDYSVVTCQALFYLIDGRPWIQNWTQGDFGFEKDGDRLVLWYNLTNDNATRGLASSGNDPVGAGLKELPTHVIILPAGTKPLKQLPPFSGKDEIGRDKPLPNNDAQGWFTPYIEICELRFESPAR